MLLENFDIESYGFLTDKTPPYSLSGGVRLDGHLNMEAAE